MSNLRNFITVVISCLIINASYAAEMPNLSSIDFMKQTYRGFNLDNASKKSAANFDALAAMNVNLIRLFLNLERCGDCTTYTIPPDKLAQIDQAVLLAEEKHIYIILTIIPEPPKDAKYWSDTELQTSIIDIWTQLAKRYKGRPSMGGFDLINEPSPPGRLEAASSSYVEFAGKIIKAIRTIDPQRMIVFEPAPRGNANYGFKALSGPLPYNNVLYSLHFYQPLELTHQGIYGIPLGMTYPNDSWNKEQLSKQLDQARKFKAKYNVPIYAGEFSCARYAPNNSAYLWNKDVTALFEAEGWSWTFHSFRGFHAWDQELPSWVGKPANEESATKARSLDTPVMTLLQSHFAKNKAIN
ncbi:MAG: cellulase family glycosylhydrolase [Sulfuriferula sp.]